MNRAALAAVLTLSASTPAQAQSWEVSWLAAYTPSVDLHRRAPELSELHITGGFTWGIQAARSFTPRWAAEVLWAQQASALEAGTGLGSTELFTLTAAQLQGNVVYRFGDAASRLQPFVFGGLGATFFHADDIPSETKLSLGFGGGIKYFAWHNIGLRAHFRYKPTILDDESAGDFCDPF